uniref:Uncharacterized protein n=1 Tax=Plectus sambesii TaxID=2011161 RepID=A0A914WB36_9BILA
MSGEAILVDGEMLLRFLSLELKMKTAVLLMLMLIIAVVAGEPLPVPEQEQNLRRQWSPRHQPRPWAAAHRSPAYDAPKKIWRRKERALPNIPENRYQANCYRDSHGSLIC